MKKPSPSRPRSISLLLLSSVLVATAAAAQPAVPRLTARVTDQTATLRAGERQALEARLADFETKKGSQVAVLIVKTTQPEAIEQYSIRIVEAWKLGRRGMDDGVLLIVAKDDRRARIEVGRGLEGAIPDAIAKRIVADVIVPHFRHGDYYGGIAAGAERIFAAIEGEALPAPSRRGLADGSGLGMFEIGFVALILVASVHTVVLAMLGRAASAVVTGGLVGIIVWFLSTMIGLAILAGLVAAVLALFSPATSGRGWSSSSGWGSGGFGGGGFGGGGGFSGGGGGFGGGGASGSW